MLNMNNLSNWCLDLTKHFKQEKENLSLQLALILRDFVSDSLIFLMDS